MSFAPTDEFREVFGHGFAFDPLPPREQTSRAATLASGYSFQKISSMHPAFATMQLGPFLTDYHRRSVDQRFRNALGQYLEEHLLPQVDEPFDSTTGTLKADVNEERFCGPNSLVKDKYTLKFSFLRQSSSDTVNAKLRYYPGTGSFGLRGSQPLTLWTPKRKELERAFRDAIGDIVSRIMKGEAGEWNCPQCHCGLRLVNSPDLFDLSCLQGCFNYNFHRHPQTGEMMHGHFFTKNALRAHWDNRGATSHE
jgi:hypothetical protein